MAKEANLTLTFKPYPVSTEESTLDVLLFASWTDPVMPLLPFSKRGGVLLVLQGSEVHG